MFTYHFTPAERSWWKEYWIHLVRPSVRPSVCRRHGFRSITQICFVISYACCFWLWTEAYWFSSMSLSKWPPGGYIGFLGICRWHGFRSKIRVCFGISISNFIRILLVAMDKSLLIFSNVIFKMAAWRPYWIFRFPDSNFTLALNIKAKLK